MKSNEYYALRMRELEEARNKAAEEIANNIIEQYEEAVRIIDDKIRAWYQRIAKNNEITVEEAYKLLDANELKEFHWDVRKYIEKGRQNAISGEWVKELENASAKYHITRLEAIKTQAREVVEELAQKRLNETTKAASSAYTEAYYHTAFEVQKGFGVGWSMEQIDERRIRSVLSNPWAADGRDFSARIHSDLKETVKVISAEITRIALLGESPDKSINEIVKRLNISKNRASTMVYTESAMFAQMAQKECFEDLDVEKYIIVETLDEGTCDICGEMDGKIFLMSEWEMGVTAPLFHPRCRGTTSPYYDDMESVGDRFARDVETGEGYYLPKDVTYKQWKEMQDSKYGDGTVDKKRRMRYNRSADEKQYERYLERLGEDAPSTFEEFQKLKYDYPEQYNDLMGYYRYKGDNPESGKTFYEADRAVKALLDEKKIRATGTVVIPPKNGVIVAPNSHALTQMEKRAITREEAQSFIDRAVFALKQRNGTRHAYYSSDGFAVIDKDGTLATAGKLDNSGEILYNEVMKYVGKSSQQ